MNKEIGWIQQCLADLEERTPSATPRLLSQFKRMLEGNVGSRPLTNHEVTTEARALLDDMSSTKPPQETADEA